MVAGGATDGGTGTPFAMAAAEAADNGAKLDVVAIDGDIFVAKDTDVKFGDGAEEDCTLFSPAL